MGRYPKEVTSKNNRRVLKLYAEGYNHREIAAEVGLNTTSVYRLIKSEKFTRAIQAGEKDVVDEVRKIFLGRAKRCAKKIVDIAEDGKPEQKLQFDAAKEILYQIGCKPVEITETRERQFSPEELTKALDTMKEVQLIAERLNSGVNRFVIDDAPAPCSPVPASLPTPSEIQPTAPDAQPS